MPTGRILILINSPETADQCAAALQPLGSARIAQTVEQARQALDEEPFDMVVCAGPELLPFAQLVGREQRHRILDGLAQGVCVLDRDSNVLWENASLRERDPAVADAIRNACSAYIPDIAQDPRRAVRRRSLHLPEGLHFELTISALLGPQNEIDRVIGLVYDTSAISRMRERLDAIDAAGRELVALDVDATARLELGERLHLLEDKLIDTCHDLLNFTHFAVLVLDPASSRLETVLMGGFPEQAKALNLHASQEGNGICGYVAATGQSYICPDVSKDPLYLAGYDAARSSLTVPLRLIDRVVGVLNVEADRPDAFSEEDRQVAEIFARYIAVALHTLKLLAVERTETTGEVTADVRTELAKPLNDILTKTTWLLQSGAADPPEARERLQEIIELVDQAKQTLQRVTEAPALRGLVPESVDAQSPLRGRRVLIADDEDIIRETIADVLAKAGALTVMARDGEEAISMVGTQYFDLILSDIKMPHRNGYEVFAAAKEAHPDCQVILITGFGYDPEHSIVRASREGLSGVLFKPFKVEQLFETIHKALGGG